MQKPNSCVEAECSLRETTELTLSCVLSACYIGTTAYLWLIAAEQQHGMLLSMVYRYFCTSK